MVSPSNDTAVPVTRLANMYRGVLSSGLGSHWRREVLRTSLWFVPAVLVLASIGIGTHGEFVPHVGVTVTLGLMVADLAVLIYFIHHTAVSIQLPQVIASIAADLAEAIKEQGSGNPEPHPKAGPT